MARTGRLRLLAEARLASYSGQIRRGSDQRNLVEATVRATSSPPPASIDRIVDRLVSVLAC